MAERRLPYLDDAIKLWQREVDGLREATLSRFVVGSALCIAAWLFWLSSPWGPSIDAGWVVLVVAGIVTYLAHRARSRHRPMASVMLVAGWLVLQVITIWFTGNSLSLALGMVAIVMGTALLGSAGGLLTSIAAYASGLWVWAIVAPTDNGAIAIPLLALYFITWAGMCIAQYPLAEALDVALNGWFQLQDSLAQVRERRAELGRTLRALEEATYRIERMNSELLLARYEADTARENKQRFAQTVSHELRGPLNLILGFSKLMAMAPERYSEALPRSYRADVDAIFASSQHIANLLDDVLDLSQIESERMPIVKQRVDFNRDVVGEAVQAVAPLVERKGLTFAVEVDNRLPQILGDRVRLRQVLLNLLTNAIRFTDHGAITVKTMLIDEGVQVSVADTGRGIPMDDLPRLFEEFHQLHLMDNLVSKGSGLGLAISRHLVNLHGGRIWAESKEGQGTLFRFVLPLGEEGAVPMSPGRPSPTEPISSTTVLVVHDEPHTLRILARYLDGYQVIGLNTGEDLLDAIQSSHPHAIIATPDLCPTLAAIVAETPYDVPVLGCSMPTRAQDSLAIDTQAYLMKPVNDDALYAALRRLNLSPDATILVVDDEPDAVRLLESRITAGLSQFSVLRAYGGEEALSVMRDEQPDAVLMDLVMPGIGADGIMRQMQLSPQLARIPVIIVTGQDAHPNGTNLGTQITLASVRPVSAMQGITRLKALLDVIEPDYLPHAAPGAQRQATAPR